VTAARRHLPTHSNPRCGRCGLPIAWARTLAGPNGPGGKAMPLDPEENPAGNVAVRNLGDRWHPRLVARVLGKDDTLDEVAEIRAMPHFATCQPTLPEPPPDNVVALRPRRRR
jgi:hypothetical protein